MSHSRRYSPDLHFFKKQSRIAAVAGFKLRGIDTASGCARPESVQVPDARIVVVVWECRGFGVAAVLGCCFLPQLYFCSSPGFACNTLCRFAPGCTAVPGESFRRRRTVLTGTNVSYGSGGYRSVSYVTGVPGQLRKIISPRGCLRYFSACCGLLGPE